MQRLAEQTPDLGRYASRGAEEEETKPVGIAHVDVHGWGGGDWSGYGSFGWPWPGLIWLVVAVLFWAGLIALLVWAVRSSTGSRRAPDGARETLRRRLAAGEITEEEYERIKRLLWD